MNNWKLFAIPLLPAVFIGCASANNITIPQPIGPAPAAKIESSSGDGYVQVFSGREKAVGHLIASDVFDTEEVGYESAHTDYTIFNSDGNVIKVVRNSRFPNDSTPALVRLPAGRYKIAAKGETGDGWSVAFDIPVVIKQGRNTVVHLDPAWAPSKQLAGKGSLVRGYDGRIIGWQADP